jgi:hypothetical protein
MPENEDIVQKIKIEAEGQDEVYVTLMGCGSVGEYT